VVIDTVPYCCAELRFDTGGKRRKRFAEDKRMRRWRCHTDRPANHGAELFSRNGSIIYRVQASPAEARRKATSASAVALMRSIDAFRRFVPEPVTEILVSGGGAENPALIDALSAALPSGIQVRRFADVYFDGEAKEAVAFALLGWLFLENKPGCRYRNGARGPRILAS
jgi:anhydro-N-acetylmuramic acid kinase